MNAKKIVAGSVAGAALAWSAGAQADWYDDIAAINAYVQNHCEGTLGVEGAWAACASVTYWWLGNDFTSYGAFDYANYCYNMSWLFWGSGGS